MIVSKTTTPTKHSPARIGAVVIASLIALVVSWHAIYRTTKVCIDAIDDGYDVRIRTSGRSPLPLTPEGPFPKWSELTWLTADGPGEVVQRDGTVYKKYTLGKDLRDRLHRYSSGSLCISPESNALVVDVQLSGEHQDLMNQSGRYGNVTIEHPPIVPLAADTPVGRIDGKYVRARGRFRDKDCRFEAAGRSFPCYGAPYGCKDSAVYEVIGVFHSRDACGRDEPQLEITSARKFDDR
jgi:hypothetical protein